MKMMNQPDINKIFKPLFTSKKRYFFITGGRGSLKSSTIHQFIAILTFEKGHGILFTRYTMTSAEKSIIPEFKLTLERLAITDEFHITKNKIINKKTKSFIYFSGIKTSSGDQTANLKSISGITTWIIEEGEDFNDEKAFDTIDDSIRTKEKQNRIIWIQNPSTKTHFIYQRWIKPKNKQVLIDGYNVTVSDMPNVEHIHTTYKIALHYLDESWIAKKDKWKQKAVESNNPYKSHYYHNYIGGWLEKAEGVIFEDWETGTFDESLSFAYGLDFGFSPDPTTMCKVAVDNKRRLIFVEELFYKTNLSTEAIINELNNHTTKGELIIADAAEKRLINDIRLKGVNVQPCQKFPGSVKKGIKDMLGYKIIVCGDSPNLKEELNEYKWNDKKAGIPEDNFNHCIDSTRYAFERLSRSASIW
jgi:phage terminase large subunit